MYQPLESAALDGFEGRIPHMYLDGPGNVTAGCGFLIPDPYSAVGLFGDVRASDEWGAVKHLEPGHPAAWYGTFTVCRLTESQIDAEKTRRLAAVRSELERLWAPYAALPPGPKDAVTDCGYNVGVSKWLREFPKMVAALAAGDWQKAADESERLGIQDARNAWTRLAILSAAMGGKVSGDKIRVT